ncbi:MAG: outer membrane beta-barrel protein [Puniceicoccales bacterium]|jgi:hypothetical protein|nr:outer membrane beta-barrel protein [Puniceicoccales bacterium]
MRKLAVTVAWLLGFGVLCADGDPIVFVPSASHLTVSSDVKFSSARMYRGRREMSKVCEFKVEISERISEEMHVYAGLNAVMEIKCGTANNASPYCGIIYNFLGCCTADFGYIRHFYTSLPSCVRRCTNEIYVGLCANVPLSPSLYCFYDFIRDEFAAECKIGQRFWWSETRLNGFSVYLGAEIGWDRAQHPFGVSDTLKKGSGYCYYSVDADLIYAFSENAKASIGVFYGGNLSGSKSWANGGGRTKRSNTWLTASANCSF